MDITFISKTQVIVWALTLTAATLFYVLLVRPRIKHHPEFVRIRGNVLGWLKVRWDMTAAAAIMALPLVWNGLLDGIIALSMFMSDALPALAGLDLSLLVLPDWLETCIRVGAVVLPLARRYFFKDEDD